jgi:DNA-binding transcriptional ArsR family regulator
MTATNLPITNVPITNVPVRNEVPMEIVQQVADYFTVLAEPMRLRILNALRDGELSVQQLVEATATSQANVSKHLKVMLQAGILARRPQGTLAYYSVADDLGFQLCTLVCDRLASRIEQQALYFREFSVANGGTDSSDESLGRSEVILPSEPDLSVLAS